MQISLDGATAEVNDAVRGAGSYATAIRAMENLRDAGFAGFKISVVMTRQNVAQLDEFKAIADRYGAQLRITRLRPSGRGADVWDELHVTAAQQRELYDWLLAHGENVLTGDSFFHLAGYGEPLPGLNLCGAGRVVCLIDPVGDVYACPFAIHENFLAGNVRAPGGFTGVWRESALFAELRRPQTGGACTSCSAFDACRGGCMAAKFFTGLPLDGPDPECVKGNAEGALRVLPAPKPSLDHSHRVPVTLSHAPRRTAPATRTRWPGWPAEWRCSAISARRTPAGGPAAGALLAVPLGSTEQHGPHLPLSVDTDIAVALCRRLAARAAGRARRARASPTGPAASMPVSRARSRSDRTRWSCCSSSSAARLR